MGFLGDLADQINSQFSVGENTVHSLDDVESGAKYGSLGDFAKHFDQSAERRYVEEGYLRRDPFNTDPKQYEILMQEPNASVLVKKKMFSSINENYRPDYMDKDEKLYYKAMKILFQNKCAQVSSLEKLSKIQKITSTVGSISDQLMPVIISLTDDAGSGFSLGGPGLFGGTNSNGEVGSFTKVIDRIRRLYAFNTTNPLTTWITDPTNLFQSQFGQGTGVIEITNFTNLSTNVGLDIKTPGSFNLTIQDPYEAMLITEYDIERAISDATNSNYNHKIFQFGQQGADQVINDATVRLNQLRSNRKASPITFRVNPDTLLGRRVVAIIDRIGTELPFEYNSGFLGIGGGVKVAASYLFQTGNKTLGDVAGFDGLNVTPENSLGPDSNIRALNPESEFSVFQRLVTAIFSKMQLDANSRGAFVTTNKNTNYARRKLRFHFSGKLIIQPMDTVHIYMNSKSRYDNKLLGGLNNMFTGSGILQNLNKTITDFKNAADTLFNPSGSVNLQAEKASFVGPDFPNFLWSLIRNQFVTEKEGTHVFAGIVQGAEDAWSDGKFTVSVRGTDNSAYFEMGKINFKPGVDVFNGALLDPLTPFKTKFDTITSNAKSQTPELLDENKFLLGVSSDTGSPLVKFKLGPNVGQPVRGDNFIQDVSLDKSSNQVGKIFYAPDGLVYKWKEGIGTLVQFGESINLNDANRTGNPAITKEPFAGQDVMNVISLLITGLPYNFANYWKAVSNFDGFQRDPQSQQDSAYSYYDSLKSDLTKNNIIWGNFIPFKNLSIDEQSFAKSMQGQFRILQNNQDLNSKLQKLAEAQRRANMFSSTDAIAVANKDKFSSQYEKAKSIVSELTTEINSIISRIQKDDQSSSALVLTGGDVSFDFNEFQNGTNPNKQIADAATRRLLRRQINYLTRRMSYNVRANDDKNLFIVDDYYDKDYDIIAYEQALTEGIKLYNNEFTSVKDKIISTSELLNLEVFCDTQGHVRVRPPQYNRMPSSIFYRMMFLKKSMGVQIFPQFLDDIFGDQINTLKERIEIIEDKIRLDCAVLGIGTDKDSDQTADWKCIAFITNYGAADGNGEPFSFLSEPSGTITDLIAAKDTSNPDANPVDKVDQNSRTFTQLQNQATSTKNVFTNSDRFKIILQALTNTKLDLAGYGIQDKSAFAVNKRIDNLINRLRVKSGQQIPKTSYLVTSSILDNGVNIPAGQSIDVFKTTQELADSIRDRQKVVKLLFGAVKNSIEANSLDDDSDTGNNLLTPGNYGNSHTPEIFEHMIEDESYDDYGPGSGSRYIIKRAQIKSINISENPPDFTMIEVKGQLSPLIPNASLPGDLNSFPQGGNGLVTAAAVDYDMWRNYGFRGQAPINVPFLSDPNSQCAPYASMILSRARRNILRGTVTISGNEYMQPGEVVFLQDRNMLFYVSSVRHNFSFGSSFTTTLELTYGHTPGEYIPTTLDVIGKLIYNNRDISSLTVQRQSSSASDSNVGIVIRDRNATSQVNTGNVTDPITSFSASNAQSINNILYTTAYIINSNNTRGNTIHATLELRIYHDKSNPIDSNLQSFADSVKELLTNPNLGPKQPLKGNTGSTNAALNKDDVDVIPVDLSDNLEHRSPSQKAYDAARNQVNTSANNIGGALLDTLGNIAGAAVGVAQAVGDTVSKSNGATHEQDKLRQAIFKYVVDCWVKFTPVAPAQAKTNGI
jgi:hypothetical protein